MAINLEELSKREVMRIEDQGIDIRVYDTSQIVMRGFLSQDGALPLTGTLCPSGTPIKGTFDPRTGKSSYDIKGKGSCSGGGLPQGPFFERCYGILQKHGIDMEKYNVKSTEEGSDPENWPAFKDFLQEVDKAFGTRAWVFITPPAYGFFTVLSGRADEVSPWEALKPAHLWWYFRSTFFPLTRVPGFDFELGRQRLQEREQYLPAEEVQNYNGMVAHIKPLDFCDQNKKLQKSVDINIYKPNNLFSFLAGEYTVKTQLPSKDDSVFQLSYGMELGNGLEPARKWLLFDSFPFSEGFIREHKLDMSGKHSIYLKVPDGFANELERTAPLPL